MKQSRSIVLCFVDKAITGTFAHVVGHISLIVSPLIFALCENDRGFELLAAR